MYHPVLYKTTSIYYVWMWGGPFVPPKKKSRWSQIGERQHLQSEIWELRRNVTTEPNQQEDKTNQLRPFQVINSVLQQQSPITVKATLFTTPAQSLCRLGCVWCVLKQGYARSRGDHYCFNNHRHIGSPCSHTHIQMSFEKLNSNCSSNKRRMRFLSFAIRLWTSADQ